MTPRLLLALALVASLSAVGSAEASSCYTYSTCVVNADLAASCKKLSTQEACSSPAACSWSAANATCAALNVCTGLAQDACAQAMLPKGGNTTACSWSALTACSEPTNTTSSGTTGGTSLSPAPATMDPNDPCAGSSDPCCRRASSFTACVLDSPADDGCAFQSSGCQMDWHLCSSKSDYESCSAASGDGCSWVSTPGTSEGPSNAAITPDFPIPAVSDEELLNPEGAWWSNPDRSDHGPFDLLTPPFAAALMRANASRTLCTAIASIVRGAVANKTSACDAACGKLLPELSSLGLLIEQALGVNLPMDACDGCHLLFKEVFPLLPAALAMDEPQLLALLGAGVDELAAVCPAMLDNLLWVAKHFDLYADRISQPLSVGLCPALGTVVAASGILNDTTRFCGFFPGSAASECASMLSGWRERYSSQQVAATQLCLRLIQENLMVRPPSPGNYSSGDEYGEYDGPRNFTAYDAAYYAAAQSPAAGAEEPAAAAQSTSGWCEQRGSSYQCQGLMEGECALRPACRLPPATCYSQPCSAGDSWCRQRRAAMPVCAPIIKQLLASPTASVPIAKTCGALGMCASATSEACLACKTQLGQLQFQIEQTRQHFASGYQSYGSTHFGDALLSTCLSTLSQLMEARTRCAAVAAVAGQALLADSAAAACAANAAVLCKTSHYSGDSSPDCSDCTGFFAAYKELAAAGAVPASAQGAADLCFSASSERGGSFLDSLRMALQWRHSCDPAVNACCLPLPASSFLSTRLAIRGVVPLTAAACSELPGCLPDSWCWPTWGKDACRSFTNSTDCMDEEACQWYSWGNGAGNCADASLTAKCRLAGQEGGRASCLAVVDDQGTPLCSHQQTCQVDWALQCSPGADACCSTPDQLLAPEAEALCANRSTGAGLCDLEVECYSRSDPCNAFVSAKTCDLKPTCVWRNTGGANSYQGYCASLRDACYEHRNSPDACSSNPACRAAPRCSRSYCQPGDACCLIHAADECAATPGCGASGWCSLAWSPCWDSYEAGACTARGGCTWQTYSDGSAEWGWCSPATDPCAPHHASPVACASVLDAERGIPACRYQTSCYSKCAGCSDCTKALTELQPQLLALNSTSQYAQAMRSYCEAGKRDWWTCWQAWQTVTAHPEAALRPAALCRAVNMCSDDCIASLGLKLCSTNGAASGAIPPTPPPSGTCATSATCTAAQTCDTAQCTRISKCETSTGLDITACGGTCVSKCSLLTPLLNTLNAGTCLTGEGCAGEGQTCSPIAGRQCSRSVCDPASGAVTSQPCDGFCLAAAAPSLVSAQLSSDGRRIELAFDQAVIASSSSPSLILDAATTATMGRWAYVAGASAAPAQLNVFLDHGATIRPDDAVTLRAKPAVASALGSRVANGGSAKLQAPTSPATPTAAISGPTSLGSGCGATTSAAVFDGSASSSGAGRDLAFEWSFSSAPAGQLAALQAVAAQMTTARLVLPGDMVASLPAGDYTLVLSVRSWLNSTATTTHEFKKLASELPQVAIVGGAQQTFSVAAGIRISTAIELSTVCPGKRVTYLWTETSGRLPAGSFAASKSQLVVKGPVPAVDGTTVLTFRLSATLEDAGTTTADLTLTAQQSDLLAVISGPRGDVLDTVVLTFNAASSLDPDDVTNKTPFAFLWTCVATDPATQVSKPCDFANAATAPDMTAARLEVAPGSLPAGSAVYTIGLRAAKGGRADTDSTAIRVLEGVAPTGVISRFCPGAAGCTSKLHSPTEPLRLVYTLSNATLAPRAQYRWSSADVDLPAAAAATTKQSLILQPFTAAEQPVFADGSTVHLNISVTADGKTASATISVPIARRPSCTAAGGTCLSVSPAAGPADAAFLAEAAGFAADAPRAYDFGLQPVGRKVEWHARGSAAPRFTFAPRVLPAGTHTVVCCAKDPTGAQACSTATLTVEAAATPVSAEDVSAAAASLATAVAAGSSEALLSAVRQVAAASTTATDATAAAVAEQAASAMDALHSAVSSADGTTPEEALGVAGAAASLVAATTQLPPQLAASALEVAESAVQALAGSSGALQPSDLDSVLDIAGTAAPALAADGSSSSRRRRRLLGEASAEAAAAALQALTSSASVTDTAQGILLASLVPGESAACGTGALQAAAAVVDELALVSGPAVFAIGDSGAAVTLPKGFGGSSSSEGPAQLRLAHTADPSLLLTLVSSSLASVPSATVGRTLLAAGPNMAGAVGEATVAVSGVVNFTSSYAGAGTISGPAVTVRLPLNNDYAIACLRLDDGGAWRADAIAFDAVADGAATCLLSNLNDNQIMVVQYQPVDSVESPASPVPSPSPSNDANLTTATVPTVTFTVRLAAYTPANFTSAVQDQFITAIQAAAPGVNTLVTLSNIRAGSVIADTKVFFLVTPYSTAASKAFARALRGSLAEVLPAGTWGEATVTGIVAGSASVTVPTDLLSPAPAPKSNKVALIAGCVAGGGAAVLIAAVAIAVCKAKKAKRARVQAAAQFPELSQPTSPLSPGAGATHPFLTATHQAQPSAGAWRP